jgi:hypothetical protein
MPRVPLLGGAYTARSVIANAQRSINYFPEVNAPGAPVPITHYQRPGLRPLVSAPTGPVRGIYRASNGNGYCVVGQNVYVISSTWVLTQLGSLAANKTTPVNFIDNGIDIVLVDGSTSGYSIHMTNNAFATIVDGTGTFLGADRGDYIDTFMLFNVIGTNRFISTLSNSLTFDPLYFAAKTDYPDPLAALIVNRHEILLIGQLKSEVWYDAGLANFPFAELPGAYFEHGTVAKYSVASADISVFFLGQDLQGVGKVYRVRGYQCTEISNYAIAGAIAKMSKTVGISDAIGYTYQQDGHVFYVLQFPAGDQTWVFDDSPLAKPDDAWHQRCWTDPATGGLHRDRSNCYAFINETPVVGDWENGTLYALDTEVYSDTVYGAVSPLTCVRSFPHYFAGEVDLSQAGGLKAPVAGDGKRVQYHSFELDMDTGNTPGAPVVILRWSFDRGHTFGTDVLQNAGLPGQYATYPTWQPIGISRDVVFEIQHSIPGPAALNGAWTTATVLRT